MEAVFDELGVDIAGTEIIVPENLLMQWNGGLYPFHLELLKGTIHDFDGIATGGAVGNNLGNQGIVIRLNGQVGSKAAVKTHPRATWLMPFGNLSWGWHKVVVRILGIDAALNGMAPELYIPLANAQRLPGGNLDLGTHQINAGNSLSNAMLNLDTRVDFHKVELVIGKIQQKFYSTDAGVVDALGSLHRQHAYLLPHILSQGNGRGFLQKLLVAALDGAFTLS